MPHSGHALARTRHGPTGSRSTSSSTTLALGKPVALQNSTIPVATCSTLHSDVGIRAATTQEQIPVYRMSRNSGLTAYTDKHEPNDLVLATIRTHTGLLLHACQQHRQRWHQRS